jgi:hypothetical protein
MKNDGGLPWWDIAFEAEATPANLMICHRADRRTLSGSAFAPRLTLFTQDLQQLGWTIGSSLQID